MPVVFPGPSELDLARADLEALRAKAGAVLEVAEPANCTLLLALRAELEKPSGASLLAEIASLRERLTNEATQAQRVLSEALAEAHANGEACDAWKALAKAREIRSWFGADSTPEARAGVRALRVAIERLKAMGIEPSTTPEELAEMVRALGAQEGQAT